MIRNIIFDLGGVLLNIDYQKTAQAFEVLGVEHFDQLFSQFKSDELFSRLETGHISEAHFYQVMETVCAPGTTAQQIKEAWNAMLLDFRTSSLDFLPLVAARKNIYLLSNTNSIHLTAFQQRLLQQTGKPNLDGYFRKSYYSHLVGKRKPHPDIYRFVLEDAALRAEETLFIDDSHNNVEAAEKLGLHTHLLKGAEKIEDIGLLNL